MATRVKTESVWQRILLAPLRAGGIMLFIAAPFAGTAISQFIDCNDAFWAIACGTDIPGSPASPSTDTNTADLEPADEVLGEVVIDSTGDPTCRTLDNGFVVCNS